LIQKVLHISHLYPSNKAPYAGTFIRDLYRSLNTSLDVKILVPTPYSLPFTKRFSFNNSTLKDEQDAQRVYYLSIPRQRLARITKFALFNALKAAIQNINPDVVHIHWTFPELMILPEIKKLGIPVVNTIHGFAFYTAKENPHLYTHIKNGLLESDYIITVGNQLRKDIIEEFSFTKDKCSTIYNGIDAQKFSVSDQLKAQKKLTWDPKKVHILCVSNTAKEKGTDLLVEAISKSDILKHKAVVHIVGKPNDLKLELFLKNKIQSLDIDQIIFHGPKDHSAIPIYYNACDFFVLPSRNEGFGVALVEAAMCGKPLVSTKSGGPEDILNGKNGILIEKNNSIRLKDALEIMIQEFKDYNPQEIRNDAVKRFSSDVIAGQLLNIYSNLK
tara:strand:- start:10732 stop:11892 length:1161 start_codon:yes stop_codon:yes gene_type:complete